MAAAPAVAAAVPDGAAAGAPKPNVAFRNERGLLLAGTFARTPTGSNDCVILCHGYAGNRDDMALPDLAEALSSAGLNSLRFDFSGNGDSEGTMRFANFDGEVADVAAAKAFLETRGQRVVGLLGHSKGGDVVLLYAARHGDIPRVINLAGRYVMSEGLLTRFGADIMDRLERGPVEVVARRGDRGTITLTLTLEDVKERTALDIPGACAAIAARNSSSGSSGGGVALLTIHGAEDSVIPPRDARMVSEAVPGSGLTIIEGTDHNFTAPGPRAAMVEAAVAFFSAPLG